MLFVYVQYIYNHVHSSDAEKCPRNELAKDPDTLFELEDSVKGAYQ